MLLHSFEQILRQEYKRRSTRNPRYSLRAFARSMEQDASTISKVLNGKRRPSRLLIRKLGPKLGLPSEQIETFARNQRFDARKKTEELIYSRLSEAQIKATVEWFFTPIYLLTQLVDFQPDCQWVAEKLALPLERIREAVDILQKVGLLTITEDGSWHPNATNLSTIDRVLYTDHVLKMAQANLIKKAQEALEEVPLELRDQSSMVFSFRQEDVSTVREYIRKFRRRLDSLVAKSGTKNSIYAISISFFPLTKVDKSDKS